MQHLIKRNDSITIKIKAEELYSSEWIQVEVGEKYQFSCSKDQRWKDWFISSDPNGFFNPLAAFYGLRVPKAKCFCLCGVFNEADATAFQIGTFNEIAISESGRLSFFANDAFNYYSNNKGHVSLMITRIL